MDIIPKENIFSLTRLVLHYLLSNVSSIFNIALSLNVVLNAAKNEISVVNQSQTKSYLISFRNLLV